MLIKKSTLSNQTIRELFISSHFKKTNKKQRKKKITKTSQRPLLLLFSEEREIHWIVHLRVKYSIKMFSLRERTKNIYHSDSTSATVLYTKLNKLIISSAVKMDSVCIPWIIGRSYACVCLLASSVPFAITVFHRVPKGHSKQVKG